MKQPKRIGKILTAVFGVFIVTSLISVFVGIFSARSFRLIDTQDTDAIKEILNSEVVAGDEEINYLDKTIKTISVSDFSLLLTNCVYICVEEISL